MSGTTDQIRRPDVSAPSPAGQAGRLSCPRCVGVSLQPYRLARAGAAPVEADHCASCEGVWFDARELGATLGRPGADTAVPGFAMKTRRTACPRCRVPLFEFCWQGTQVLVDGCRQCHGTWLDKAEWPQIHQALPDGPAAAQVACPKCRAMQSSSTVCACCGAIFAKVQEQRRQEQQFQQEHATQARAAGLEENFGPATGFRIRQRVEWLEILSPFERANRYEVMLMGDRTRHAMLEERSRSVFNFIGRQLLGGLRAAHLELANEHNQVLLTLDKAFRLFFHELTVKDPQGRALGSVRRRFHILRENYEVRDRLGRLLLEIKGPLFFLPFVDAKFRFLRQGQEVGQMTKRWRGVVREHFTDADVFLASLSRHLSLKEKVLLFGAVVLIDFGHYENNSGGGIDLNPFDVF
jgi:Zn-finger nucleic acid-binding protein